MGVVLRSAVAFLFIFLLLKLVGKKELSELSPFELILLVVIGDIVQQGITQEDFSLVGAVLAASTLALMTVAFSYMSFKFDPARRLLEGLPVVILRDGELLPEALKFERLQPHEVDQAARKQGLDTFPRWSWPCSSLTGPSRSFLQARGTRERPSTSCEWALRGSSRRIRVGSPRFGTA